MFLSRNSYFGMVFVLLLSLSSTANSQESIFDKDRPDYKASGARVGAFKLKPQLSVEQKFDDNIFSVENTETEDHATVITPDLKLESDWSRHALNLYGGGKVVAFNSNTAESYEDYDVGINGRLDAFRETFITGGIDFQEKHESRGSPDNDSTSTEPTEYSEFTGDLGFYRGLRKLSLSVDGQFKNLDFDDGLTSTNTVIDNDDRDRDQYKTSVRLGYEFIPDYEAFIRGVYNTRSYDDTAALDRDSDGYDVTLGTAVNISGKVRGEVFVGYMQQEYDATTLNDIEDAAFGANFLWNPTQITSLTGGVERTVEETTTANSSGYVATAYTIAVEHELMRNVLVGANAAFVANDYESTAAIERNDELVFAGAEAKYLVNRNAALKLNYAHENRDSNIANQDYAKNLFTAGFALGF